MHEEMFRGLSEENLVQIKSVSTDWFGSQKQLILMMKMFHVSMLQLRVFSVLTYCHMT